MCFSYWPFAFLLDGQERRGFNYHDDNIILVQDCLIFRLVKIGRFGLDNIVGRFSIGWIFRRINVLIGRLFIIIDQLKISPI